MGVRKQRKANHLERVRAYESAMTDAPDPPITAKQLQLLQLLLREAIPGRDADARRRKHGLIAWLIDRDIESTRDLTKAEARTVIDVLVATQTADRLAGIGGTEDDS